MDKNKCIARGEGIEFLKDPYLWYQSKHNLQIEAFL
jgi:hypothetical protein